MAVERDMRFEDILHGVRNHKQRRMDVDEMAQGSELSKVDDWLGSIQVHYISPLGHGKFAPDVKYNALVKKHARTKRKLYQARKDLQNCTEQATLAASAASLAASTASKVAGMASKCIVESENRNADLKAIIKTLENKYKTSQASLREALKKLSKEHVQVKKRVRTRPDRPFSLNHTACRDHTDSMDRSP
jgi:hypothetical protein